MAQTEKLTFIIEAEDRAKATLQSLEGGFSSLQDKIKANAGAIAGITASAGVAFAGIMSLSKGALSAFADAEAQTISATKLLENTFNNLSGSQLENLKKSLGNTKDALGSLKTSMGDVGKQAVQMAFDDETASTSFARLFASSKDAGQAHKDLSLAMDLARSKGIGLEEATKAVLMVHAGNTRALKEYNITLDENATSMDNLDALNKIVGGSAKEFADSTAGGIERMKVQTDNLNESLGAGLAPAFKAIQEAIAPVIKHITDFVEANPRLSAGILIVVGGLAGLVAVVGALSLAMLAFTAVSAPVLLVIGGIALAIGAIIALFIYWKDITEWLGQVFYDTFEAIKNKLQEWWTAITTTVSGIWTSIKEVIDAIVNGFKVAWEMIKQVTVAVFEFIKNYFTIWGLATKLLTLENMKAIADGIVEAWTIVKNFFVDIWNSIKNVFQGAIDYINNLIDSFMNKVNSMMSAISRVGSAIGGGISSAVSSVAGVFKRATGGNVSANTPYVVGENGQEVFVPSTNGSIFNQNQLAGMGGITINLSGNTFLGKEGIAESIGDELVKILRLNTKI